MKARKAFWNTKKRGCLEDSTKRYYPKCPRKLNWESNLFHSCAMELQSRRYNYTDQFKQKSVGKFSFSIIATGFFHIEVHIEFRSKAFEILKHFVVELEGSEVNLCWMVPPRVIKLPTDIQTTFLSVHSVISLCWEQLFNQNQVLVILSNSERSCKLLTW